MGTAVRRIYPLVIAALLPLGVCPSTRANYILSFTGHSPASGVTVTMDYTDAVVAVGKVPRRIHERARS
jgi:hypothetical protein